MTADQQQRQEIRQFVQECWSNHLEPIELEQLAEQLEERFLE